MQTLHVAQNFDADPATVFDVIADHAGYASLPGVRRAYLRHEGDETPNGVGALRVIQLPGVAFEERITEYVPGQSLGYRIERSPLPIDHIGARLLLQPLGADGLRTRVNWTSRLRARAPFARDVLAAVIARQMAFGYGAALRIWARRLR